MNANFPIGGRKWQFTAYQLLPRIEAEAHGLLADWWVDGIAATHMNRENPKWALFGAHTLLASLMFFTWWNGALTTRGRGYVALEVMLRQSITISAVSVLQGFLVSPFNYTEQIKKPFSYKSSPECFLHLLCSYRLSFVQVCSRLHRQGRRVCTQLVKWTKTCICFQLQEV